ncbi:tryptophan halogenase family protein [Sphingomonas abietis]|uniref:Tryptophan 7-halogenase n=1 Tax=Sphingomonas abietis TaxID=3012344 RepID=A0ABY7NL25_9SPHN|nr:tryptophan halogenase family protein [Sphingomonas abietis]WBO21277.1 tryptophan 7-halogenase [Sphingomonas abietis]
MVQVSAETGAGRSGDPIRSVVIVGGGTAGWMTAALMAKRLEGLGVAITLVESSSIGTIGVGEATTPAIRDYFREAGLDEAAVMRASHATIKLGIAFDGWAGEGSRFFHPFGLYGTPSNGVAFHQYWLKLRAGGDLRPIDDYCLATQLAYADRFLPPPRPAPDYAFFDWAVHFDAGLYARYLAEVAMARGVRHVDARVRAVTRDPQSGHIAAIDTEEAGAIRGDLFVDCSGFRSLLLGQALGEPFIDWTDLLPCDRAAAIPCAHAPGGGFEPYTRSTALAAGWQWRIPLQHRVGNGYVYASRHISDDEAVATLIGRLEGEALAEPNLIRFTAGHRRQFWSGNCVAIGLSAGFLEPLESTSITLIHSGIERLLQLFPDRHFDPALAADYNRISTLEYERVRDFLLLHYWGNKRANEPLWQGCRDTPLPDKLAHKIRMFTSRGRMVRYEWDSFQDPSWLSLFAGLGLLPERWDPLADFFTPDQISGAFDRIREKIAEGVASASTHRDYAAAHFAAASQGNSRA